LPDLLEEDQELKTMGLEGDALLSDPEVLW
jgi:hypothetical protein